MFYFPLLALSPYLWGHIRNTIWKCAIWKAYITKYTEGHIECWTIKINVVNYVRRVITLLIQNKDSRPITWDINDETNIMDIRGNCRRRPIRINQYGQVSLSNYIDTKEGFSLILENRSIKLSSFKEIHPL